MTELFLDLETFSEVDLKKSNVYRYTEDEGFLILMAAWAVDDGPVQIALTPEEIAAIPHLWDDDGAAIRVAFNAGFERICCSRFNDMPVGEYLPPEDWDDPMILAAEHGYPKKLEHLAVALGAELKDSAGTRLINLFCRPNRQGKRNMPEDFPEEWEAFKRYCMQDVETLRDVRRKLPGWPTEAEREAWLADQRINDAGIPVDTVMAAHAVEAAAENAAVSTAAIKRLTGIENPNSGPQMLAWLQGEGVPVTNLQAATVKELLEDDLTPKVRSVLEMRQDIALVAAKKYSAALDRVSADGRLRGSFQFFGAHTGRFAGRGVQLQNLPRAALSSETATTAAILDLKLGLGASPFELKALVRAMFVGPFTVVDYSAIEARVIAWLGGEQWALDAFYADRDIYVETASRMNVKTRQEGKVATLALGYAGGVNSLRVMGAEGSDAKLQFMVDQWREANPSIVTFWRELDESFKHGGTAGEHITIEKDGRDRMMTLPSGRAVVYHDLRGRWVEKWGKKVQEITFADPKGPGFRTGTYGGKLAENATQAVARDILTEAMVRLQDGGYEVVGHVHDECIVKGTHPVEDVSRVMVQSPAWGAGLPIAAAGFITSRYRKD